MRRRIAAFVVILVVVVVLLFAFNVFGGDNNDEMAATETTSVSVPDNPKAEGAAASGSETMASHPSSTAVSEEKDAADENAEQGNAGDFEPNNSDPALASQKSCELSDLVIQASSDSSTYPSGVQPNFGMTVINPTGADCNIDLDEQSLRFEVYRIADNKLMWTDTDCYESVQKGNYTFPAGEERSFSAVWSRLASERGGDCSQRPAVEPGAYFLHTVIGDNASEPYTFNLA